MPKNIVEACNLFKTYNHQQRNVEVLNGVNITLTRGETVSIVGPSGAGKSTLLYLLGLLERPSSGSLLFDARNVNTLNDHARARIRLTKIGFVFQFHHLLPEFTALENVMLPGLMLRNEKPETEKRAGELLNTVGLHDRHDHKPGELSGGEQQRVAFARAMINSPELILADEPTGNLDRNAAGALEDLMWVLCREKNTALLIVTHNPNLAATADQRFRLVDGHLQSE